MPQPFSLLIKPASADCNLRCEYCFYLDHCRFYSDTARHRMSEAILSQMIRSYMATPQPSYQFGWQGGEPTLMGLDFFRRVTELQQQYGQSGVAVANGLQTNGTLITDDMAAHFAEYHFLLGVSLDGPRHLHDRYRLNVQGGGSFDDVLRGIGHLKARRAEFNILTLVNAANVAHAAEVYRFLCDSGYLYHQYIPCVEADAQRRPLPFSIAGPQWGDFLCTLFDLWRANDTRRVSIRLFDSILALLVDGVRNICHLGTNCCQYFVVEYNGDVFPCDFFVEKRLLLGNVATDAWATMQGSPLYREFGQQKSKWNAACDQCDVAWVCAGDCLKHRLCQGAGDARRLSELCAGWKQFLRHALPGLKALANDIVAERMTQARADAQTSAPQGAANTGKTPGRNDPCPCGSGRKFKHCCTKH